MARTFALIALVHPILHQLSCTYEMIPNAPKYYETHRNISLRCVPCKKFKCDIVARTFALIAPVQYVLQQVSCSYETIPNAPKYYKMHRNIGIGSNGVDWLFSLRKIQMWRSGTNFCNNCTSSPRFAPTFMQLRNDPKCTEILWNRLEHLFRVHQGGLGVFVEKNPIVTSRHQLLH